MIILDASLKPRIWLPSSRAERVVRVHSFSFVRIGRGMLGRVKLLFGVRLHFRVAPFSLLVGVLRNGTLVELVSDFFLPLFDVLRENLVFLELQLLQIIPRPQDSWITVNFFLNKSTDPPDVGILQRDAWKLLLLVEPVYLFLESC